MLTLHHAPQSRSSRIIWLLEELGAPYEIRVANIPRMDGSGGADPGNPHPDKKVPALVDDGVLITESIAIVQYLADKYPDAGLAPAIGHRDRGPYLSWLAYYAGVMEPILTLGAAGLGDHPMVQRTFRDRAAMDARVLAGLTPGPFLLGERFSAADLLLTSIGQWTRTMLPPGEVVDAYLARCTNRPAVARAWARDAG